MANAILTAWEGGRLLVAEFTRPGLAVDRDHIDRYQEYIDILREGIEKRTQLSDIAPYPACSSRIS